MDFSQTKFRASSWGNLLTSSKDGKGLGLVCQKELIKIYNQELYGRKKDLTTRQMDKGILVEEDSIMLYSQVEGKMFFKNEDRLENEWFTGHPDIFLGDNIENATEIHDIKSSYELDSFTPKLIEAVDKGYEAQLNVYYSLVGEQCTTGNIVYCLVSAPESVLFSEHEYLLRSGNFISPESPDFIAAWEEKQRLLVFDDIDYRERVIKISVPRNEELIEKMKERVPILRQWLQDFHTKHMALYPKE